MQRYSDALRGTIIISLSFLAHGDALGGFHFLSLFSLKEMEWGLLSIQERFVAWRLSPLSFF